MGYILRYLIYWGYKVDIENNDPEVNNDEEEDEDGRIKLQEAGVRFVFTVYDLVSYGVR